jgi:hypothetical protein
MAARISGEGLVTVSERRSMAEVIIQRDRGL